jgi:Icc-related predicted phosphoesterase
MKIVSISDTHGQHETLTSDGKKLPYGDVLVHAGDFTKFGRLAELQSFCEWFDSQPHSRKVFVAGNHDACLETSAQEANKIIDSFPGIDYLQDSSVTIDGKLFYGSPYTPRFMQWHFMETRGAPIKRIWDAIPDEVDVLITHGPAYGHGDLVPIYPQFSKFRRVAGCVQLLLRIQEIGPDLHICGHIHDGHGITRSDALPLTTFINAATCTERYSPSNPPIEAEIS